MLLFLAMLITRIAERENKVIALPRLNAHGAIDVVCGAFLINDFVSKKIICKSVLPVGCLIDIKSLVFVFRL